MTPIIKTKIIPGRRVVITGAGVLSPIGSGLELFWKNMAGGMLGISKLDRFDAAGFDVSVAAQIRDFDPLQAMDRKEARRMDRYCQLAVAAAAEAVAQSGLDIAAYGPERVGTIIGSGVDRKSVV